MKVKSTAHHKTVTYLGSPTHKRRWSSVLSYSCLIVISILFIIPLYVLVRNALSTQQDITSPHWHFFPQTIQWHNFSDLFTHSDVPFVHSMVNSLIISVISTCSVLLLSAPAGYAFARSSSRISRVLWAILIGSLLIPATVSFVPSYVMISSLGWLDSLHGIIIPGIFQAFSVMMYRQFFRNFPLEIEEAACLDGLSPGKIFVKIVLPNALPITASLAVLVFLETWNSFFWPFIVASAPQSWTVQLTLSSYLSAQSSNFPELFAATMVSIIPAMLVFLGLSKKMIQGIQLGNSK